MDDISDESQVEEYLRKLLHKEAFDQKGLIYGMGHAVYSISDPRAQIFKAFVKRYPNIKCIARHVRFAHSCSENSLSAYLWKDGEIYESRRLTFHILDRVGGGRCICKRNHLRTDE